MIEVWRKENWQAKTISNLSIASVIETDVKQLRKWHSKKKKKKVTSNYLFRPTRRDETPTGIWQIELRLKFLTEKIFRHEYKFRTAISWIFRLSGNYPNLIAIVAAKNLVFTSELILFKRNRPKRNEETNKT